MAEGRPPTTPTEADQLRKEVREQAYWEALPTARAVVEMLLDDISMLRAEGRQSDLEWRERYDVARRGLNVCDVMEPGGTRRCFFAEGHPLSGSISHHSWER